MNKDTLGGRIRHLRTERGLSQEELARRITGASRAQICRFETGTRNPSPEALAQLAVVLGTTDTYLIRHGRARTAGRVVRASRYLPHPQQAKRADHYSGLPEHISYAPCPVAEARPDYPGIGRSNAYLLSSEDG